MAAKPVAERLPPLMLFVNAVVVVVVYCLPPLLCLATPAIVAYRFVVSVGADVHVHGLVVSTS